MAGPENRASAPAVERAAGSRWVRQSTLVDFAAWSIARAESVMHLAKPDAVVRLPGMVLAVHSRNAPYIGLVKERIADADDASSDAPRCRVLVVSGGQDGFPPVPRWGDEIFHPRHFEKALEPTPYRAYYLRDFDFWQVFDVERNIGVQWMPDDRGYPAWDTGAPLRAFIHWFYNARSLRLAHAGTLGRAGVGVLLAGKGGSGKSGTVVAGVMRGLQTVGDDYVLVDTTAGSPRAHPVFRTLKQDAGGLRRLGLLGRIAAGRGPNWQEKYEFLASELAEDPVAPSLEIKVLVLPSADGAAHSSFEPVSPARAMLALAPSGLFQMPSDRDAGAALFADLVRRLPCFTLSLSEDPGEIAQQIDAFLSRLTQ